MLKLGVNGYFLRRRVMDDEKNTLPHFSDQSLSNVMTASHARKARLERIAQKKLIQNRKMPDLTETMEMNNNNIKIEGEGRKSPSYAVMQPNHNMESRNDESNKTSDSLNEITYRCIENETTSTNVLNSVICDSNKDKEICCINFTVDLSIPPVTVIDNSSESDECHKISRSESLPTSAVPRRCYTPTPRSDSFDLPSLELDKTLQSILAESYSFDDNNDCFMLDDVNRDLDDVSKQMPTELVKDEPDDLFLNNTYSSAFPSMPESFLQNLGLINSGPPEDTVSHGFEDLSPEEIEDKFQKLSLAYRTDLITLEQRLDMQRRIRDKAEETVENEIAKLLKIYSKLSVAVDNEEVLGNFHDGLLDLKESLSNVSGDAEILGAVEQECRLSKAMELMIAYVDHLKKKHEKESVELNEARQLLSMNNIIGGGYGQSDAFQLHKRAYSVSQAGTQKVSGRRNSVAVLPRMVGQSTFNFNTSQDSPGRTESSRPLTPSPDMDAKCMTRSFTAISTVVRKTSNDLSPLFPARSLRRGSDTTLPANALKPSEGPMKQESVDNDTNTKLKEDDAFQRGFAQGIRAHLGRELTDLRSQQQCFSEKLDDLMDENDKLTEEDIYRPCDNMLEWLMKLRPEHDWPFSSEKMRATTSLFLVFLALICALYTVLHHSSGFDISPKLNYEQPPPA